MGCASAPHPPLYPACAASRPVLEDGRLTALTDEAAKFVPSVQLPLTQPKA